MSNKLWLIASGGLIAAILGLSFAAINFLMNRMLVQGQSDLAEVQQSLVANVKSMQGAISKLESDERSKNSLRNDAASDSQSQPANKTSLAAPLRPAIRMPKIAVSVSSESLDVELEQVATALLGAYPNDPESIHVIALMRAQTRQYEEARKLWDKCRTLAPSNPSYYVNLASLAIEQGDYTQAVDVLENAKKQGLNSESIAYHFAISLPKLGRHQETIVLAKDEIQRNENPSAFWLILGQSQLELGETENAEASFRKAMELGVQSAGLYLGLGNACMRLGKQEEARQYLRRFSELKSDTLTGQDRYQTLTSKETRNTALSVLNEAAMVSLRNRNAPYAEHLLLRCLAIDPVNLGAMRSLANVYFQTKRVAEERVVRERILEIHQESFSDFINLAKSCAVAGDLEAAEAVLKQATSVFPLAVEPFAGMSEFYFQGNKLELARWYAQQAIDRQPTAEAFRYLARICKRMNDANGEAEAIKYATMLESKKQ